MNEATTPQKDFLLALLRDREVPAEFRLELDKQWATLTKVGASMAIDAMKSFPFKPRGTVRFSDPVLLELPKSFYAIPAHQAEAVLGRDVRGDLVFLEVSQWNGRTYMKRLFGAPGRFNRERMSRTEVAALAKLLSIDPVRYIKLFGEHFTVCGKCGAELTDQKSRETGFGPVCRKQLGL